MADTTEPKIGRPSAYDESYNETVTNLCLLGLTDEELASYFHISTVTLNAWKHAHPSFLNSLKKGREEADMRVARAMYKRATGFSRTQRKLLLSNGEPIYADDEQYFPPDVAAAFIWLKNRRRTNWKDRYDLDVKGNVILKDMDGDDIKL